MSRESAAASIDRKPSALEIQLGLRQALWTAQISPVAFIRAKCGDLFILSRKPQITVNDRKSARAFHPVKDLRRNHMNAGESQCLQPLCRAYNFFRLRRCIRGTPGSAAAEQAVFIEEQMPRTLPLLNRQRDQRLLFGVKPATAIQISRQQ